ncbi:MAG: ComF family protein [Planctomycetaceae bacterium]|nr:ComF family protein [Planctomycetaceae bacterium]
MDLFYPPVCFLCNELKENSEPFCEDCAAKLTTPDGMYCQRCGGKRVPLYYETFRCRRCRTLSFRFRKVIVLGEYEDELRTLILRMKTDQSGLLARSVVRLLARQRAAELREAAAELIVPVPMYWHRRLMRGVNSPDFMAEELGNILNIPVAKHLVRRVRPTDLQYMLSARNRKSNVVGAFALNQQNHFLSRFVNHWSKSWLKNWLKMEFGQLEPNPVGKNILLVDDIFTTGSTCNEVAKILRQAGVRNITVCALARAVGFYQKYRDDLFEKLAKKRRN